MYSLLRTGRLLVLPALLVLSLYGCDSLPEPDGETTVAPASSTMPARGRIVVANRASGTISVIDTHTDEVVDTVPMPDGGEPMSVVYVAAQNRVLVGDRANSRVVAFNAQNLGVEGAVATGVGVFHMWADPQGKQLWVVNDIDDVVTVVDPKTLTVIASVPIPGGKPHDVVVGPAGKRAFVSVIADDGTDEVRMFDTATFGLLALTDVGDDPHVSLARQDNNLYVPCQNTDDVFVLDRTTLAVVTTIAVPGAHGAGMARNGKVFYTTNLPGGGTDGLLAIDTATNAVIDAVDTPFAVPHNIALTPNGRKIYITHSGATSDQVSIHSLSGNNPLPTSSTSVTVGLNPFGLAFVP